jgi:integrase
LFCRPHMCRHSFALKWFSVLSLAWEQRLDGFTAGEAADLRDMFGDVWFQLASLMGHADPSTTRETYLEPFSSLRLDYLMLLLDEDERAGVDPLVRAVAAGTGKVLAAVPADGSDLARTGQ